MLNRNNKKMANFLKEPTQKDKIIHYLEKKITKSHHK